MDSAQFNRALMAANFARGYGKQGLKRFLRLLKQGVTASQIAREFEVSRERVRQWKQAFGREICRYEPAPEVLKLAGMK